MRQGLSLKYVIGGGASLLIIASLVVYMKLLSTYTQHGLDYIGSYLMEEEALFFAANYKKNAQTPLPQGAFFTGVIGEHALPENVRELLLSPPARIVGTVRIFEDPPSSPFPFYVHTRKLNDGKTLYLFETQTDEDQEDAPRLSEEYFDNKMLVLLLVGLSVPVIALLLVIVQVWLILNPLRRLTRWSTTLANPCANTVSRPNFSYKELNTLAASLADSVRRVKAASLREERLLRYCSHELRTPLAITKANLQLMSFSKNLSPPLQRIQRSVHNMQNITDTLLWMSSEHCTAPIKETVDVLQILEELIEDHRYLLGSRQLKLYINVQKALYLLPPQACQIVFGNLLRNALQYADEGGIEISCTPQQLTVINQIASIDSREDSAGFGYGLGLELVQQLCERLGWQLHRHTAEQRFTAVIVFAPLTNISGCAHTESNV